MTDAEQPFKITVPDDALALLKAKLDLVTLPDELDDAGWAYGAPLADIKRLVGRWKDGYDWRKHEKALNDELPQFTRDVVVDGFGTLNVHYGPEASWKSASSRRCSRKGRPTNRASMSSRSVCLGTGSRRRPPRRVLESELCHKLMTAVGYDEYVTQGGDWGGIISRAVACAYGPKHVKAWHTNFPVVRPPPLSLNPFYLFNTARMYLPLLWLTQEEKDGLQRTRDLDRTATGYFKIQSTKPQTLGYSLADSPVGLLGWIYEKLVAWSDKYEWTDDEVLTWISIYWFSRSGPTASLRIYYETTKNNALVVPPVDDPAVKPVVPMGISFFPAEVFGLPRHWVRRTGNVVFEASHKAGGHFAAYEVPELLAGDLRKMLGKNGPARGVISARPRARM
ncbi:EHN domain-containing protein [Mycena chlorophos]|uniref:EHN domain-containing protein n=1 Tax=Mycena chlorophos TaxID=658473 RepID=A0A8H6TDZ5_MYCCL|nr:EHN domain-containing protein [Mycena chlorophos]